MLSPALNYDFICYPLKTQYFDRLDHELQSEVNKLFSGIEAGLTGKQNLKAFAESQVKNLFNLRMKAIGWFLEDNNLDDLSQTVEQCYDDFDSLSQNSKLVFFVENLKFALRANRRLVDSFMEHAQAEANANGIDLQNEIKTAAPKIDYEQFVTSIALGVPDEEAAQRIIDLVGASLLIEFSAMSGGILVDQKIEISEEKAIQLTSLIKDAAQNYSAICHELGLFKRQKAGQPLMQFDHGFVEEQQFLADLGLEDLSEN